jgi:hypothetical protein
MDLFFYSTVYESRRVKCEDHEKFDQISFDLSEISQLSIMNKEELLGLMAFCKIRRFNDVPIIACNEDEMRLAYCVWRGDRSRRQKKIWLKVLKEE